MGGASNGAGNGGGGTVVVNTNRAGRTIRLLLLFVFALAAVEYLFGSILDASPIRTYLHTLTSSSKSSSEKSIQDSQTQESLINATESKYSTQNSTMGMKNDTQISTLSTGNTTNNTVDVQENSPRLITKVLDLIPRLNSTEASDLNLCASEPYGLGPIQVNKTELELDFVEKKFPEVNNGGRYSPSNCTARHRVAIIVPYRDRQQHLAIFLNHMHPFLMKQQIEYGIYIIEQIGKHEFNRAKLMNVGFVESQRDLPSHWQCFIFHDIDLLPLDLRNMYSCPRQPRHMSAAIDKFGFQLPYEEIFGGVSAMTLKQFKDLNGFSNKYWGWGGEDDDMFYRLDKMKYSESRYKMSIARYAMLDHKKSSPNPKRYQLLSQTSKIFLKDGLSTLSYELLSVTHHHLYTHVLVNIDERSLWETIAKFIFGDSI